MTRDLLSLCGRACKEAERQDVEAEAFASWRRETETEIEGTNITIGTESTDFGIGIRVIKDGMMGYSYTSVPKRIAKTVRAAISASKLGIKVGYRLPSTSKFREIKGIFRKDVLDVDVERSFEMTREIIEGARSVDDAILVPSGGLLYGSEGLAIANTRGLEAFQEETIFSVSANAVFGTDKTAAYETGTARGVDVEPFQIGRQAGELAKRFQGGQRIKDGKMDVLFRPSAMSELLAYTLIPSFSGERVATGESFLKDKIGKNVTWKGLTIKDDARRPNGLGSAICDDEGVRSRSNVLIDKGVLRMYLYDLASAAKYGAKSTGNGLRPGFRGVPSTSSRSIVLEAKATPFEKMLSKVDRGVLVHDIMGAHTANMASTDFSVNSSALFMVEKGEITHPISNAMISGNLGELLNRIGGLGDDVRVVPTGAAIYLPTVWFKNVQVNG